LAKAVQSTQKLAQFRGRGTTFAFRTNSADENDAPKNRQLAVSIAHVQTKQQQQLERLTEQNSSSQVGAENAGEVREAEKAPVMPRANSVEEPAGNEGEELPSLSLAAPPNSSVKDVDEGNSSWADDEEGGEVDDIDEDEFPTDMVTIWHCACIIISCEGPSPFRLWRCSIAVHGVLPRRKSFLRAPLQPIGTCFTAAGPIGHIFWLPGQSNGQIWHQQSQSSGSWKWCKGEKKIIWAK
jgi:hypothetical protein